MVDFIKIVQRSTILVAFREYTCAFNFSQTVRMEENNLKFQSKKGKKIRWNALIIMAMSFKNRGVHYLNMICFSLTVTRSDGSRVTICGGTCSFHLSIDVHGILLSVVFSSCILSYDVLYP